MICRGARLHKPSSGGQKSEPCGTLRDYVYFRV
jgi:hypothetical protein